MRLLFTITLMLFCLNFTTSAQNNLSYFFHFENQQVKKYNLAEIGVIIPNEIQKQINDFIADETKGLNPYDAEKIDLTSTWIAPSGKTQKVNGFYFQNLKKKNDNEWIEAPTPQNWLLRWSPDEVGNWRVEITLNVNGNSWSSNSISFTCLDSDSKGFLTVNPLKPNGNKYLYQAESDIPFFAIGHNVAHGGFGDLTPKKCENHRVMIQQIADGKGNFTRIELGTENYLPSGYHPKNYSTNSHGLLELDKLVSMCDEVGVHFIAFRHHTELGPGPSWSKTRWAHNSYKTIFELPDRISYFTNPEVLKWQRNELRYLFARWGYSKSFSFYGYSEIEGWISALSKEEGLSEVETMKTFTKWWVDQKNYIEQDLDMKRMLFANSFSGSKIPEAASKKISNERELYDIFLHSDIVAYHKYGNGKSNLLTDCINFREFHAKNWDKPLLLEECGFTTGHIYCASDQNFFNALWTSVFYNDLGTAMNYWSIRGVNDMNFSQLYEPVYNFNKLIDRKSINSRGNSFNQSIKKSQLSEFHLTSESKSTVYGYLFDPSYYWRNMTAENTKMNELVFEGKTKVQCETIDDYGIGQPLSNENPNFDAKRYEDAYTQQADKTPMTAASYKTQSITVKGLERTGIFSSKKSYTIEYYDPRNPDLKVLKTEEIRAKRNGKIEITMDSTTWPACAFIIKPVS